MSDVVSFLGWMFATIGVCAVVEFGYRAARRFRAARALARRCMPAPTIILVMVPRHESSTRDYRIDRNLDRNN